MVFRQLDIHCPHFAVRLPCCSSALSVLIAPLTTAYVEKVSRCRWQRRSQMAIRCETGTRFPGVIQLPATKRIRSDSLTIKGFETRVMVGNLPSSRNSKFPPAFHLSHPQTTSHLQPGNHITDNNECSRDGSRSRARAAHKRRHTRELRKDLERAAGRDYCEYRGHVWCVTEESTAHRIEAYTTSRRLRSDV